ncbi:LuxR family transcriptional regulator [Variovorax guangxiensis]|uniref:LuxR family transcriptional regulator n=1 Tax=Variovorax guangxiensis TaxID=1775474 RepID=A0A433MR81_9BURK|nr:LuxR family transcriptional regulator [Variovorax guangxiensis]
MTHLTRGDCASALRLLEQLESGQSPVRHHGVHAIRRNAAKAPGRREFRRASMQAEHYRRAGLEHVVAVALLYRLTCADVSARAVSPPKRTPALTPREGEVMHWLARGKTDAEIAALLQISPRTVHKHLQHVYVKLGVETRTAAVMRALGIGSAL